MSDPTFMDMVASAKPEEKKKKQEPSFLGMVSEAPDFVDPEKPLRDAVIVGSRTNTDTAAKKLDLSKKTGVPYTAISDDRMVELENLSRIYGLPVEQLSTTKTGTWAAKDPVNVSLIGNRWDNLLSIEDKAKAAEAERVDAENQKTGRTGFLGVLQGLGASLGYGAASLAAMPLDLARVIANATMDAENAKKAYEFTKLINPVGAGAQELATWFDSKRRATESALVTDATGEQRINWGAVNPLTGHGIENIANMVMGEAVPMAAQYAIGVLLTPETGGGSLAAVTAANAGKAAKLGKFAKAVWSYAKSPVSIVNAGRVIAGQADSDVKDLIDKGMTEDEAWQKVAPGALLAGVFSAAVGSPLEAKIIEDMATKVAGSPGGLTLMSKIGKRLQTFAIQGGKEGAQEVLEGIGEDLAAFITYNPDKTMKEFASNALMNFVGGAGMGGVMGASIQGTRNIQMSQNAAFFQALHDEKSKVEFAKNAPEKWKEAIAHYTQGGALEEIGIPVQQWNTYWQSVGEDPRAKAEELGVSGKDFADAVKMGQDLVIKTEEFADKISGTENYHGLAQDIRFIQGEPTMREQEALDKAKQEDMKAQQAQVDEIVKRFSEDPEAPASKQVQSIQNRVKEQLTGKGSTEEEAQAQAELFAKQAAVLMVRGNMTPEQFFNTYKLTVNDGEVFLQEVAAPTPGPMNPVETRTGGVTAVNLNGIELDPLTGAPILDEGGTNADQRTDSGATARAPQGGPEGVVLHQPVGTGAGDGRAGLGSTSLRTAAVALRGVADETSPLYRAMMQVAPMSGEPKTLTLTDSEGVTHPVTIEADGPSVFLIADSVGQDGKKPQGWMQILPNGMVVVRSVMNRGFRGLGYQMNRAMLDYAKGNYLQVTDQSRVVGKVSEDGERARVRLGTGEIGTDTDGSRVAVNQVGDYFPEGSQRVLNQPAAPVFYSALQRTVPDLSKIANKDGMVDARQAESWLAARQKEGKFKQAELDAVGLPEFLKLQKGKVSVADIEAFVKQNGVQVQEVVKGGAGEMPPELAQYLNGGEAPQTAEEWLDASVKAEKTAKQWQKQGDTQRADHWFRLSEQMSQMAENLETPSGSSGGATKYSRYQLPGGTDYRELLLILPPRNPVGPTKIFQEFRDSLRSKYGSDQGIIDNATAEEMNQLDALGKPIRDAKAQAESFNSSHWDEANILSHIRFNTRTDADGKKVLFIEEIQSDWGQKGKKSGFSRPLDASKLQIKPVFDGEAYEVRDANGNFLTNVQKTTMRALGHEFTPKGVEDYVRMRIEEDPTRYNQNISAFGVPSAPFVTDTKAWVALSIKRMIRYAAENGFDRVAFVNGEQSADRYDLSKSVDRIVYRDAEDGTTAVSIDLNGERSVNVYVDQKTGKVSEGTDDLVGKGLDEIIGKEIADKILTTANRGAQKIEGSGLKVGGEGMKAFYDKIVPQVANEVLKKLGGGKVGSVDLLDHSGPSKRDGSPLHLMEQLGFDITPEMKAKVVEEGQALFQPGGADKARGQIVIGNNTFNLTTLHEANVSTAAHEFGHFFLAVMEDMASREGASQQVKDDLKTIIEAYGENGVLTDQSHEKFADAHLLYLLEGVAPSAALQPTFSRYSSWLAKIWNIVKQDMVANKTDGVVLTDEVRGVFDRLYASDAEIEAVKYDLGKPMFATAEAAGMTEAQFALYSKTETKRIAEGKEKLLKRLMAERKRNLSRARRELYAETLQRIRGEVEARPEYQALLRLTSDLKLSKQALLERGVDLKKLSQDGIKFVYSTESTLDPDTAATLLVDENGQQLFPSGDALVQAVTGLESRIKVSERLAEAEVAKAFPDSMMDPAALKQAALESMLDGENQARVMAIELQALRRKASQVAPFLNQQKQEMKAQAREDRARATEAAKLPDTSLLRQAAIQMLSTMGVYKLNPNQFLVASRKANNEAFKSMAKNDYQAAATAKEREILNHFLYLEATKIKDGLEKFGQFDAKFDTSRVREKIGNAGGTFLEQIDALRLRFGLSDFQGEAMGQRTETLAQWSANNDFSTIDPALFDEGWKKNYKTMTVAEHQMLWDALKNIKTLAYRETDFIARGISVSFDLAGTEISESIAKHNTMQPMPFSGAETTRKQGMVNWLKGKDATLLKIEALINWMDGGKVDGPAHRYLWQPLVEAQTARYDATVKIAQPLQEALRQMPEAQRKSMADTFTVQGFRDPLSRKQILSMLFNMGNEDNRKKLVEGYDLTPGQLSAAFAHLNAQDLAFVQATWDTIETLWPEMVALEKRTTGTEPKKVQPMPLKVYDKDGNLTGELRGGYWPIKYDPKGDSGDVANKMNAGDRLMAGTAARPGTSRSATKERTGYIGQLLLDYEHILTAHLNDVIMDLTHREALNSIDKLTRRDDVRVAIQSAFGHEYYEQLNPWLKTIAGDGSSAAAMGLSTWNRTAMAMRSNAIAAVLGFKFTSAFVQLADMTRVMGPGDYRVKARHFTSAFLQMLGSPSETINMVREMSGEMRHRPENLDRDIRQTLKSMTGQQSLKDRYNRAAFKGLAFMDTMISIPTWLGAYQQAMAEHGDSERAVAEADRVVRLKLMSGNPKDLVAVQRDNEFMKLITMFLGDASSGYNMMRNAGHKAKGLGGFVTQFTPAAMIVMFGAILGDLLKGQGPDDDEDEVTWTLRKAALAPFQTIPMLRDGVRALDAKLAGKPFSDYQFTPAFSAVQKVINGVDATADLLGSEKDIGWDDWAIKAGEAIGYSYGVGGTAQAAGAVKYLKRVDEGEETPDNAAELIWNTVQNKPKKGTR